MDELEVAIEKVREIVKNISVAYQHIKSMMKATAGIYAKSLITYQEILQPII